MPSSELLHSIRAPASSGAESAHTVLHQAGVNLMLKGLNLMLKPKPRTLDRNNLAEYSVLYRVTWSGPSQHSPGGFIHLSQGLWADVYYSRLHRREAGFPQPLGAEFTYCWLPPLSVADNRDGQVSIPRTGNWTWLHVIHVVLPTCSKIPEKKAEQQQSEQCWGARTKAGMHWEAPWEQHHSALCLLSMPLAFPGT